MPVRNLRDIPLLLTPGQCLLGLDNGAKHIGLAISDPGLSLASPLLTLERGKFKDLQEALTKIIKERAIGGIIIGLPLQLDGQSGPAAQSARTLASNLEKAFAPNMVLWDERFSTAVMQRELICVADMSRSKRAAIIDKLAAAYMLQGALDFLKQDPLGQQPRQND